MLILRSVLKQETEPLHRAIEESPRLKALLCGQLTLSQYERMLLRLHSFYRLIEGQLGRFVADLHELKFLERLKTPLLEKDLQYLDLVPSALSAPPEFRIVSTLSEALGILYVLEGSTLGGQVIAQALGRSLSLGFDSGAAFYNGYRQNTGAMWKSFILVLESFPLKNTESVQIIDSAKNTFRLMTKVMNENA